MYDGTVKELMVHHVPLLRQNLLSLSLLEENSDEFSGKNGVLNVCDGSQVYLKGIRIRSLYHFQGHVVEVTTVKSSCESGLDAFVQGGVDLTDEPCMAMLSDAHVGDLKVSPRLRSNFTSLEDMVGSRYICPSQFASNRGSGLGDLWMWILLLLVKSVAFHTFWRCLDPVGGLPINDIGSIVCLEKGACGRFCMSCVVKNHTVRKTLVQHMVAEWNAGLLVRASWSES